MSSQSRDHGSARSAPVGSIGGVPSTPHMYILCPDHPSVPGGFLLGRPDWLTAIKDIEYFCPTGPGGGHYRLTQNPLYRQYSMAFGADQPHMSTLSLLAYDQDGTSAAPYYAMRLSPLSDGGETVPAQERALCCVTSGSYAKRFDYRVGLVRYNEYMGQEEGLYELPGSAVLGWTAESPVETSRAELAGNLIFTSAATSMAPTSTAAADPTLHEEEHPEESAAGLTGMFNGSETVQIQGGTADAATPYGPDDYSNLNPSVPSSMGLVAGQLMNSVPVQKERSTISRFFSVRSRNPRRSR